MIIMFVPTNIVKHAIIFSWKLWFYEVFSYLDFRRRWNGFEHTDNNWLHIVNHRYIHHVLYFHISQVTVMSTSYFQTQRAIGACKHDYTQMRNYTFTHFQHLHAPGGVK